MADLSVWIVWTCSATLCSVTTIMGWIAVWVVIGLTSFADGVKGGEGFVKLGVGGFKCVVIRAGRRVGVALGLQSPRRGLDRLQGVVLAFHLEDRGRRPGQGCHQALFGSLQLLVLAFYQVVVIGDSGEVHGHRPSSSCAACSAASSAYALASWSQAHLGS